MEIENNMVIRLILSDLEKEDYIEFKKPLSEMISYLKHMEILKNE